MCEFGIVGLWAHGVKFYRVWVVVVVVVVVRVGLCVGLCACRVVLRGQGLCVGVVSRGGVSMCGVSAVRLR